MSSEASRPWYRYWARTRIAAAPQSTSLERRGAAQPPVSRETASEPFPDGAGRAQPAVRAQGLPEGAADPDPSGGVPEGDVAVEPATPLRPRVRPGEILPVANQKGGVGKTTTAVSLAAALAQDGARILLVDLDPQANATSGIGYRAVPGQPMMYDALVGGAPLAEVLQDTAIPNLRVAPSHIDLAGAEVELVSAFSREQRLRRALEPVRAAFDVVLVDCPPSLGLLTVNALTAGTGLIVPIQSEYYALEGLEALRRNTELIREQLNPGLRVVGFVMTMLDARTRLSQQVVDEVQAHFGDLVFQTRIPRSVRLAEAPSFGEPITVFDPASRGALAYRRLARELVERLAPAEPTLPLTASAT